MNLRSMIARRAPEELAAAVNALLVLSLPFWLMAIVRIATLNDNQNSVSARVTPLPLYLLMQLLMFGAFVTPFVGLAFIAGWRTWVHARRMLRGDGTGWQGVAEGGLLGLAIALGVLAQGIVTHPTQAPPYIIVYGGGAAILGVVIGLVLRVSALVVLRQSTT